MIIGAHTIIYSNDPEKDRAFFRDICRFPNIDAGDGWLIFGLPPAEIAVHPSKKNNVQELYLMCDDIDAFVDQMDKAKVKCGRIQRQSWGKLTKLRLPGGGYLKIYQPLHKRPRFTVKSK